jgi:tetratricopeptide (TPR) repeat protein
MRKRFVLAPIFAAMALCSWPLQAQDFLSGASDLEQELFKDAEDKTLDHFTLMEAAFIVSGVPDRQALEQQVELFEYMVEKLAKGLDSEAGDYERAKTVFTILHKVLFKKYDLYAVDMPSVFARGDYNCVSATIVFNALLNRLGIRTAVVLVPSHAYSMVHTEQGAIEVETTSPKGFDPARTMDEYRKLLKQYNLAGGAYDVQGDKRTLDTALVKEVQGEKTIVDNVTLVAIIYSNLAAARIRDNDSRSALALFMRASALASDNEYFRSNRDALLNNLVVDLIEKGQYPMAIGVAHRSRELPGLSEQFHTRILKWLVYAYSRYSVDLQASQQFSGAVTVLKNGLIDVPGDSTLAHNLKAAYIKWGITLMNSGDHRNSCNVMLTALKLYPDQSIVHNNYLAVVQRYVRSLKQANNLPYAERVSRFALREAGEVLQNDSSHPLVLGLHSELGLVLFDAGRFDEAAEQFALGLSSGDPLFVANFVAARANRVQELTAAGQGAAAHELALNSVQLLQDKPNAAMLKTYWAATINYAISLRDADKPGSARDLLQKVPLQFSHADTATVAEAYAQTLSAVFMDLTDYEGCVSLLKSALPALPGANWLPGRLERCTKRL